MKYTKHIPTSADLGEKPEAHYWVRGGNFTRPVVVRVNNSTRGRECAPVPTFEFPEPYPRYIWRDNLEEWFAPYRLEFAGPIPEPV